jgi:transcription-repair coupling factor (superfamily II helicase)
VFYVVPRVEAFPKRLERLTRLMPGLRVAAAHGQMRSGALEAVMDSFAVAKQDVLLCTTIVESGLDLPRVNTIVIEDVHLLGLSSLYQLRGRVGRSSQQAHALLMWEEGTILSEEAAQRMQAIRDSGGLLGQGFRIAEKDMAIRGVGAVFGDKQSGADISNVGSDLYMEMLYEQLASVEGQRLPALAWEDVDLGPLKLRGAVPPSLVASEREARQLELRAVAAGRAGPASLRALSSEVEAATGQMPRPFHSLLRALLLRWYCSSMCICRVDSPQAGLIRLSTRMSRATFDCIEQLLPGAERSALRWEEAPEGGIISLTAAVQAEEKAAWERQPDMAVERAIGALAGMHAVAPRFLRFV